jgi:hypothetical protein
VGPSPGSSKSSPRERGYTSDRRGRYGQKVLEVWGTQANFSAHPADPDRDGWDYFLEIFDDSARRTLSLDQIAPVLSCKVQVKTFAANPGKSAFKLSTLYRMTDPTMPWFVLVLIAADFGEVDRAYLLHIDRERLTAILRRLRAHSDERALNRSTMKLLWTDAELLVFPDAKSFVDRLRRCIGRSQEEYVRTKSKDWASIGGDTS